jgi:hypothetical protein
MTYVALSPNVHHLARSQLWLASCYLWGSASLIIVTAMAVAYPLYLGVGGTRASTGFA